jgi:hypothetical protein
MISVVAGNRWDRPEKHRWTAQTTHVNPPGAVGELGQLERSWSASQQGLLARKASHPVLRLGAPPPPPCSMPPPCGLHQAGTGAGEGEQSRDPPADDNS